MGESVVERPTFEKKMGESVPSAAAASLQVSVSFGRFESDSLSWEKWSSFSPNKYLEEVEKCSTPGSVAQKKAYFEAHYKKIAARKTEQLEQEKLMESIPPSSGDPDSKDPVKKTSVANGEFGASSGGSSAEELEQDVAESHVWDSTNIGEEEEHVAIALDRQGLEVEEAKEQLNGTSAKLESNDVLTVKEELISDQPEIELSGGEEAVVVQDDNSQKNSLEIVEQPLKVGHDSKKTPQSKNEIPKVHPRSVNQKMTSSRKEQTLTSTKKKVVSPAIKSSSVTKLSQLSTPRLSKSTVMPASLSSTKKLNRSSVPSAKNTPGGNRRPMPASLHMSLSLDPANSSPSLTTTRKSLIMESMGDKDIVRRAFKTFQNSMTGLKSPNDGLSSGSQQVLNKGPEKKVSTTVPPRKENDGPRKPAEKIMQRNRSGYTSNPVSSWTLKIYSRVKALSFLFLFLEMAAPAAAQLNAGIAFKGLTTGRTRNLGLRNQATPQLSLRRASKKSSSHVLRQLYPLSLNDPKGLFSSQTRNKCFISGANQQLSSDYQAQQSFNGEEDAIQPPISSSNEGLQVDEIENGLKKVPSSPSDAVDVRRELVMLSLPAVAGQAIDPLVQLMETAYIGRLGSLELASAGVSITVFNTISKLFNIPLLSVATSFVAEDISKNTSRVSATEMEDSTNGKPFDGPGGRQQLSSVSTALVLAIGIGIFEALALLFGSGFLLNLMGISRASPMRATAQQFLALRALGAPAFVVSLALQGIFRGFKDTKTPVFCLGFGNFTAILLFPLLMYQFGLGVSGAAISTVISQYIVTFAMIYYLNKRVVLLPPKFGELQFGNYLKSGGFLIGRTLSVLLTMTLATSMAARQGPVAMAAHQVCFQIWLAVSLLTDALAAASQALIASCLSRGDYGTVRELTQFVIKIGVFAGVCLAAVLGVSFNSLSTLFTKDTEVLKIIATGVVFVSASQPINALAFIFDGLHYGASDFPYAARSMMLVGAISSAFLLYAPAIFGLPGVWAGLTLFMGLRMMAGFIRLMSKDSPWWFLHGDFNTAKRLGIISGYMSD